MSTRSRDVSVIREELCPVSEDVMNWFREMFVVEANIHGPASAPSGATAGSCDTVRSAVLITAVALTILLWQT